MKRVIVDKFLDVTEEIIKTKKLPQMANFQGELKMLHYVSLVGELSPSDISERLCVTTARVAAALNSLEKKELVTRETSATDRRKIVVRLTKKGKKLLEEGRECMHKNISKMLDLIGEEDAEHVIKIFTKFAEKMKEKGK